MLDWEVGDVAGGEDVVDAADAAVRVDGDETVDSLRQAVEAWAAQPRQRDGTIDGEAAVGNEKQLTVDNSVA